MAWLLGRWEGAGVGGYPTVESFRFGHEAAFGYVPGKAFLTYQSRSWMLDDSGDRVRPLASETGYWRPQPDGSVEVLLAHPTGFVEIYLGEVQPARVDLVTRGVLKTEGAKDYRSGRRIYGLVNQRLLWAFDMAAMGETLQSHLSAELIRTASASEVAG